MSHVIKGLDPARFERHALHDLSRDWPETNCYVDLWIEVLAALGHNPVAALGFTVRQNFEGDQFTFFKFPAADLETLFGVEILELAIFDDLIGHLEVQTARGRLPVVELDGFYLPDTKGVSYRAEHTKTTVGVNRIDRAGRRLEYFHNAGYHALEGEDFDGLFRALPHLENVPDLLFPYAEFIKLGSGPVRRPLLVPALSLLRHHLERRPAENPIAAYKAHFKAHADRLVAAGPAFFHKYTFNVLRQLGANHELLAAHLAWLSSEGISGLEGAIAATREISATAKTMQFQLARSVARRNFSTYDAPLDRMAASYDQAISGIEEIFGVEKRRLAS